MLLNTVPNFLVSNEKQIRDQINKFVDEINTHFFQVAVNGDTHICRNNINAVGKETIEFFSVRSFKEATLNYPKVPTIINKYGEPDKFTNVAILWLESPRKRLFYRGMTFNPSMPREYDGFYNRYLGLGVEPSDNFRGDESLNFYLDFVHDIICSGNQEHYEYLICWLAHLVQKPHLKPQVAVILKAGQGTGKGSFMKPLSVMIGSHYIHPQNADHVVGRFNSQMECAMLVFADEFFGGDKKSTDKLKGMITESTTTIERKGIDTIEVPSYSRIIMASNHEHIVSIEKDERRYLFLEVSEQVKQNHDFFDELHRVIGTNDVTVAKDFASKLLGYLMNLDISDFTPQKVPKTEALINSKLNNLDSLPAWFIDVLRAETFCMNRIADGEHKNPFESRVPVLAVRESFNLWCKDSNRKTIGDSSVKIGIFFKKLGVRKAEDKKVNGRFVYCFESYEKTKQLLEAYLGFSVDI